MEIDNSYNSSNYIVSVSPDGQFAATFNSESFTINSYEIENLDTLSIISCDEIREFVTSSPFIKVSYSLAISNLIRIGGKYDVLIAVSCFCDKDMTKEMKHVDYSITNKDLIDIEKGDDFKKSATFVILKNLKTRIKTKVDTRGGIVKFLDNRLKKEAHLEDSKKIDQSNEFTNLIVMNVSGITKVFINHDDSYTTNVAKQYEFPIIIQDKIDSLYQDIPRLLQNSIVSNYLFAEGYLNQKVEMYNLNSLDLEIVFQKHDETPHLASLLGNSIFSISNYGHLLAHCNCTKNITIYLMENGLEIVTKEFRNANKILLVSFIDNDEKLFIVTEEENGLMINIWDIFTYKSDIQTNILNFLQEANYHSLAISNGTVLAFLQNGTVFSILDHHNIKYMLKKPSNELTNLFSIDIGQAQQNNLLESYSEPWDNHKQYNYISSYLDKSKTIQLIIGKTTVQVWRKRSRGSKVLEYIWANPINNERIEITSLKVGNWEFSLDLSLSSIVISANKNKIKIHWPNETHILKDACDAIKYLYEREYEVKQEDKEKYKKLVTDTENIIKKSIKKNPDLWRLSEIRYEIMTNLIQAKRILLLHKILFNFKEVNKIDANGETKITKVNRYLHIPRQYSWPVKEKKSDLEIAIEESSDKKKVIVAMLLEYYSNNAGKNTGWMFTVTKAIHLLNKRHLESYLKELFYKPCFGAKEEYLNSKFVLKFVSQNELKKGFKKNVHPLNIKPQLIEKQNSKNYLWWKNVKNSKIDKDDHETALRIVPLPDFTVHSTNAINLPGPKLFKFIFWPKNYINNNQYSPFLKFLENENKLYDNPAIEACVEFKWNVSKNYFLWHLLKFIIFFMMFLYSTDFTKTLVFFYLGYRLLVIEIAQFINKGKKYLNIYNIFDVASIIILIVTVILKLIADKNDNYLDERLMISASFSYLISFFEILLLLRMFSHIAIYINIVLNILKAALPFMCFTLILTFFLEITMNSYDGLPGFDFSNPIINFIYLFNGTWYQSMQDQLGFWSVFSLSMFTGIMIIIIIQNLLIAVMTNIYKNVKSNSKLVALKCRSELVADYEKTEKIFTKNERGNQRYIYYIGNDDYQKEWLKKAKKYRESYGTLFKDINNQLLMIEENSSSDNDSDEDYNSFGEKVIMNQLQKNMIDNEKYLKLENKVDNRVAFRNS